MKLALKQLLPRNDDYAWASDLSSNQGAAHLESVTFREIPDQSTAFLELKTGGIDLLLGVPTDFLSILKAEKNVGVITMAGTGISYMPINATSAPFDDIRVRQATALAVNQKSILENVYKGVGSEANHFLIDTLPAGDVKKELLVSFDSAKANGLLDEAGWAMGDGGVRMKDGVPLQVKLFTQNDSDLKRLTQVVQAQLKDVGMDAVITVFDTPAQSATNTRRTLINWPFAVMTGTMRTFWNGSFPAPVSAIPTCPCGQMRNPRCSRTWQ